MKSRLVIYIIGLIAFTVGIFYFDGGLRTVLIISAVVWLVGGFLMHCVASLEKFPSLTAQAKVVSKTSEVSGMGGVVRTVYFVSFEFNGRRENVKVDISFYNTVAENDVGLLEYKDPGGLFHFVDFKPYITIPG